MDKHSSLLRKFLNYGEKSLKHWAHDVEIRVCDNLLMLHWSIILFKTIWQFSSLNSFNSQSYIIGMIQDWPLKLFSDGHFQIVLYENCILMKHQ
jgi:hypothetical protein